MFIFLPLSLSGLHFNPFAINEEMVQKEIWKHRKWLVHQGHRQALEYR